MVEQESSCTRALQESLNKAQEQLAWANAKLFYGIGSDMGDPILGRDLCKRCRNPLDDSYCTDTNAVGETIWLCGACEECEDSASEDSILVMGEEALAAAVEAERSAEARQQILFSEDVTFHTVPDVTVDEVVVGHPAPAPAPGADRQRARGLSPRGPRMECRHCGCYPCIRRTLFCKG